MSKLEYIASGMAYTRLNSKKVLANEEIKAKIESAIGKLHANGHEFGVLFNAHTERSFGEQLRRYTPGTFSQIYSDSGGLQVITQGLDITPEFKQKIYETQGTWSDRGMSFDEIPVKTIGVTSKRLDMSGRWFDKDNFNELAKQTGINANDQINAFKDMKSSCKPVLIVQGNCYDTYMKWAELLWNEISVENRAYVGGVAMGSAALGNASLEDIKKAVYYKQLPMDLPENHMHILGVGAVRRLLPNLIFLKNGYYGDIHMSYDSTTHTSGPYMGDYYSADELGVRIDRNNINHYSRMLKEINDIFPEFDVTVQDYHTYMLSNTSTCHEKYNDDGFGCVMAFIYTILTSVYNFCREVNHVLIDKERMYNHLKLKEHTPYAALYTVKTPDDFRVWMNNFSTSMKSNPVSTHKPASLAEFF